MNCTHCGKKLNDAAEMFIRLCRGCYNPETGRVRRSLTKIVERKPE